MPFEISRGAWIGKLVVASMMTGFAIFFLASG